MPGITCQSPKWRCRIDDHGWSDGRRTITWANTTDESQETSL